MAPRGAVRFRRNAKEYRDVSLPGVVKRAANQNYNDCQWQSFHNSNERLPYSVFPTFSKQTDKQQFIYLSRGGGIVWVFGVFSRKRIRRRGDRREQQKRKIFPLKIFKNYRIIIL